MSKINFVLIVLIIGLAGAVGYSTLIEKSTSIPEVTTTSPSPTPTPTPTPSPSTKDINLAKQALITYFNLLETKQYSTATTYHSSGYGTLQYWNPSVNPNDDAALLKAGCEASGWQCLKIKNVLNEQQISSDEFKFVVQFTNNDGTLFKRGPCCGATEETMPTKTDFEYVVKKVNNNFLIMTGPVYVP